MVSVYSTDQCRIQINLSTYITSLYPSAPPPHHPLLYPSPSQVSLHYILISYPLPILYLILSQSALYSYPPPPSQLILHYIFIPLHPSSSPFLPHPNSDYIAYLYPPPIPSQSALHPYTRHPTSSQFSLHYILVFLIPIPYTLSYLILIHPTLHPYIYPHTSPHPTYITSLCILVFLIPIPYTLSYLIPIHPYISPRTPPHPTSISTQFILH